MTPIDRAYARALHVSLLALLCTLSCKDGPSASAGARGEAPLESESPSAKIFPAPLETGMPREPEGTGAVGPVTGSGGAPGKKVPRLVTRTLPLLGAVEPENLPDADAAGYQLDLQVPWPQVQATVHVQGQPLRLSPLLSLHLLPESPRHAARVRIELSAGMLALPDGTTLLGSSDAEGWLVVWPDQRSYRVLGSSSLRSVLEERRVDRVPLVAVEAKEVGVGQLLGRSTRRMELSSPVGTLLLESAEVPELGGAGALVCGFFLALLRADPRPHCVDGQVPVYARYQWSLDQVLEIGALRLVPRTDYRTTDFAMPPRLGIFKPGELPPREGRAQLDPINIWLDGQATGTWQVVNHHDVPLYFFVDGLPVAWLDPHAPRSVRVPPGEHRHTARDWLGQVIEVGGVASDAPPDGGEAAGSGAPPAGRPTVQYGTPPEPEIE